MYGSQEVVNYGQHLKSGQKVVNKYTFKIVMSVTGNRPMTHNLDLHDASSLTQIFCPKVEALYDGDILGLSLRHDKRCIACSIQELADLIYPRNPKRN